MLICPQCSAENPNRNNFCQRCGASLTDYPCPHCGAQVNYGESHCGACQGRVGRWLTVLVHRQGEETEPLTAEGISLYEGCIDIGQRYRLMVDETEAGFQPLGQGDAVDGLQGQGVDCQPLQPSVLKILLSQQAEFLHQLPQMDRAAIVADPAWVSLNLPESMIGYLRLADLSPLVPEVYDAWCEGGKDWVLLGDRRLWPSLQETLQGEGLPALEVVFWLNQLAQLWQRLSPLGWGETLMDGSTVRVDEDRNLALTWLLPDGPTPPTLEQWGQYWLDSFTPSPSVPPAVTTLLTQVSQGELNSIDEVLTAIDALLLSLSPPPATEDFPFDDEIDFDNLPEGLFHEELLENAEDSPFPQPSTEPDIQAFSPPVVDDIPTAVLPMQLTSLTDAGYTDRGGHRQHNEDFFGISTSVETRRHNHGKTLKARGIYVVCDGMGGHAAGEVASQMAVRSLLDFFLLPLQEGMPEAALIERGIELANQKIFDVNQGNASSGSGRMGTTLVMMLVQDTRVAIAHVGDSRIYRVTRKGGLEQLTVDHEVGQQAIKNGLEPEVAYARPDAYQLTQALGPHNSTYIQPDILFFDVEEDCLLLLCSDGISDNDFVEEHWEELLLPYISSSQDVDRGLRKFLEAANEYNGHDNLTGILVRLKVRPQIPMEVW